MSVRHSALSLAIAAAVLAPALVPASAQQPAPPAALRTPDVIFVPTPEVGSPGTELEFAL